MMKARDRSLESISVGERASIEHVITADDIRTFAEISGDENPLHMDEAYAKQTAFGGRVVHGMFIAALVSQLVGMQLPGKRALLLKASFGFKKPVHIGETLHIEGVVSAKSDSTRILTLNVEAKASGMAVAEGKVSVQVLPDSL